MICVEILESTFALAYDVDIMGPTTADFIMHWYYMAIQNLVYMHMTVHLTSVVTTDETAMHHVQYVPQLSEIIIQCSIPNPFK